MENNNNWCYYSDLPSPLHYMTRQVDLIETLKELSTLLPNVEYQNGDISDIGNEIGYQLGSIIKDMTEVEIDLLIGGIKHGISLTNGTHV